MGISVKRIVLTTVLAVLLVIVFGWVIMMQNHATLVRNHAGDETLKLEDDNLITLCSNCHAQVEGDKEMAAV